MLVLRKLQRYTIQKYSIYDPSNYRSNLINTLNYGFYITQNKCIRAKDSKYEIFIIENSIADFAINYYTKVNNFYRLQLDLYNPINCSYYYNGLKHTLDLYNNGIFHGLRVRKYMPNHMYLYSIQHNYILNMDNGNYELYLVDIEFEETYSVQLYYTDDAIKKITIMSDKVKTYVVC